MFLIGLVAFLTTLANAETCAQKSVDGQPVVWKDDVIVLRVNAEALSRVTMDTIESTIARATEEASSVPNSWTPDFVYEPGEMGTSNNTFSVPDGENVIMFLHAGDCGNEEFLPVFSEVHDDRDRIRGYRLVESDIVICFDDDHPLSFAAEVPYGHLDVESLILEGLMRALGATRELTDTSAVIYEGIGLGEKQRVLDRIDADCLRELYPPEAENMLSCSTAGSTQNGAFLLLPFMLTLRRRKR